MEAADPAAVAASGMPVTTPRCCCSPLLTACLFHRLFLAFFPPKLRPGANVQEHLVHRLSKNKGTCCGFGVDYTSMLLGSEKVGSVVTILHLQHLPRGPGVIPLTHFQLTFSSMP